ncbi:MAG: hypothetical protein R3F39_03120 [Myxococcota bacterium]
MKRFFGAFALLLTFHAPAPALAADAGGTPLSAALRAAVYSGLCDALHAAEVDCAAAPAKCFLTRADGTAFAPDWNWFTNLAWPSGVYAALQTPAEQSGNPEPDGWDPLTQASGLPAPPNDDNDLGVRKLSAAQIAWVLEYLAPRPGDTLCGAPAERLYAELAKRPTDVYAQAYLHLATRGAFKGFDKEAYLAQMYDPKGKYTKMCAAFIGKHADPQVTVFRKQACRFWLRREFVGQRDPIVRGFAEALGRFDAKLAKRLLAAADKSVAKRL